MQNISANNEVIGPLFLSMRWRSPAYSASVDKSLRTLLLAAAWFWAVAALLGAALVAGVVQAAEPTPADAGALPAPLQQQVRALAQAAGRHAGAGTGARVEVALGALDPRLRLAPCAQVQPYLPAGARPWGRTRVGLRCTEGPVAWNVYLPVTVKVFAPGVAAAGPLAAGAVLTAADVQVAEVDVAEGPTPALAQPALALGRTLARPLAAGEALRQGDLRARQFFNAGDTVQLVAVGAGLQVSAEAQALAPGLEGRSVRVRTDSGRIVTGTAVAERRVEVAL
jgi:flagella basal body P-ring formation protein FlgA